MGAKKRPGEGKKTGEKVATTCGARRSRTKGATDETADTVESRKTHWVRAGRSGICRLDIELGQRVEKGDFLGTIADALGAEAHTVRARKGGLVIGRRINPLIHQGEAVAHMAEV